jgi:hypothetical protein
MDTIKVRVIKPFKELRTPCPPKNTVGELYNFDGQYACVQFPLPMTDAEGNVWETQGDNYDYMKLKFELDEIELV